MTRHLYTVWGLHAAHRQICKYTEILWGLCVELWVEALWIMEGSVRLFILQKWNTVQKLTKWQSQLRPFKLSDLSYKECLFIYFFFGYKKMIAMICFVHVAQRVASKVSLRLMFPVDGSVCIHVHWYMRCEASFRQLILPKRTLCFALPCWNISISCKKLHSNKHEENLSVLWAHQIQWWPLKKTEKAL